MKEILLTRGKVAMIDDEDFPIVSRYKWHAQKGPTTPWYAKTCVPGNGKQIHIYMHKLLMDPGQREVVDFIDGNGLNLRRSNMRLATVSQDQANRGLPKSNRSGFKGVSFDSRTGKWDAFIQIHGLTRRVGSFSSPIETARAYDAAALRYFGAFARLNFPTNDQKDLICASSSSPSSLVVSSELGLLSRFFSRLKNLLKNILPWRL